MVDRAIGIGADLADFALAAAFGDDGLRDKFAIPALGPVALLLVVGFGLPDLDIPVRRQCAARLVVAAIDRADLDEFRFGRDGLLNVGGNLSLIAGRRGTGVLLRGHAFEEQFVMSCPIGALQAAPGFRYKHRIFPVERRVFQYEQDMGFNPLLKMTDGQQNPPGPAPRTRPLFPKA